MKIYKPNSKNTGSACSFSVTSSGKSQGIYLEIIKQKSWNDESKTGSFDKDNKINLKFTTTEAAEILLFCQRQKGEVKFFHDTGEVTSTIKLYIYNKPDGTPGGVAISVFKGDKKATIPMNFGEAILLSKWLDFALNRIFTADYTERKKKMEKLQETKV